MIDSPILAGDIRLLSKADLRLRVAELLAAETQYVETLERLKAENEKLRDRICALPPAAAPTPETK